jgi:hypothetical protein
MTEPRAPRRAWRVGALCGLWVLLGLGLLGLSWHLDGPWAVPAFWTGLLIGNVGPLYTWYFAYVWNRD